MSQSKGWFRFDSTWGSLSFLFFSLSLSKAAFIHRIGCFDWQNQGRVNALLVMQLKSVKPQTPALFQMLISLWLLSFLLPGVETPFFSIINPVLHVYLDVTPSSLSALAESKLIWVWSSLRSQRLDFLSLVCLPLCCTGSEQTEVYRSEARQAASAVRYPQLLH